MTDTKPFLVHTESSTAWGGQEIRIFTELQRMAESGWRVELWAPESSDIASRARAAKLPVEHVAFRRAWDAADILNVRELIRAKRPDVIVTHSSIDSWIAGLATRCLLTRPAIIRMRHLSTAINNILPYRWFADAVGTTSDHIRRMVIERGVDPDRVSSLPTGVDLARFRPDPAGKSAARKKFGLPDSGAVVGGVFVIRSWKGIYDFVRVAAAVPAAHFVVAGDGPSREAMMAEAGRRGVQPRMTFTGHIEEVERILPGFDVFLLPSTANEGIPQALLQAQACGIAAVVSNLPSLREAAGGARVCRAGDVDGFAAAVRDLLSDSAASVSVRDAGLDWVKQFDQTVMMRNIDRFYRARIARTS